MQRSNTSRIKIYLDLDGVMSDLRKKWSELLGEQFEQERYLQDSKFRSRVWRATNGALERGVEVWYDLDLMPDALTLWRFVECFDVEILTATGRSYQEQIRDMKVRWVAEKLSPHVIVNTTQDGVDKAAYAGDNKILIDDQQKNIDIWEREGGIGVVHTDANSTIKVLRTLL